MQQILLETHKPLIASYPHHAALFSILDIDERSLSWIFHNYLLLMLSCDYNTGNYGMDLCSQYYPWHQFKWATCPMIITRVYQPAIILDKCNLSDFIYNLLKEKNYVYFLRKLKGGFFHETFISGIDLDKRKFLVHDFFEGFFEKKWLSFDDIYQKEENSEYADWATDYLNGIWAINKTDKYLSQNNYYYETVLNFTKKDFENIIKEYIGINKNIEDILIKDKRFVGVKVYDLMINMLERYKNVICEPFAIHPFSILCEHKKLLSLAIKYIYNNDDLTKEMDAIENNAILLKNTVLYCNCYIEENNNYNKFNNIIEKIHELKAQELELLNKILDC